MFAAKLAENRIKREQLLVRSDELRQRLGQQALVLRNPLALADKIRNGYHWLMAHPQLLLLPVAVTVALRPRRVVGWALRAWWGWRLWRRVQGLLPR